MGRKKASSEIHCLSRVTVCQFSLGFPRMAFLRQIHHFLYLVKETEDIFFVVNSF